MKVSENIFTKVRWVVMEKSEAKLREFWGSLVFVGSEGPFCKLHKVMMWAWIGWDYLTQGWGANGLVRLAS